MLFFYNQESAYELRISDWSSDVFSSDLMRVARAGPPDVGLRVAGFGAHLGIGLAGRQAYHIHRDVTVRLLEISLHLLADDDIRRADEIEFAGRLRRERCKHRSGEEHEGTSLRFHWGILLLPVFGRSEEH